MKGAILILQKLKTLATFLKRQKEALLYVLTVVLPIFLRTGRRPVILSRFTGMGDIICTIPAARQLVKRHPGATVIYNCSAYFADIPRLAGIADRVTSLHSIGSVGHWYGFLLAGFYHFAHADDIPGGVVREPMVADFCRQFGLEITDEHARLDASSEAMARARDILTKRHLDLSDLILIHPGPSWTIKEWPQGSWARLVAELNARGHVHIGQLGVTNYSAEGSRSVPVISGAVSLVDTLSVEECLAAISMAKLFVGIDSGLLHIAASTRTRSIGLFGPTDPQFFYGSRSEHDFARSTVDCTGCEHRRPRLHWLTGCPYNIKCMPSITVEAVLAKCLAGLEAAEQSPAGRL